MKNSPETITFQILNLFGQDETKNEDAEIEIRQHFVYVFGRTLDGNTVGVKTPFNPYFFIEIPPLWNTTNIQVFINHIKTLPRIKNEIISLQVVKRKKFYGFTNGKEFSFLRCIFSSKRAVSYLAKECNEGLLFEGKPRKFNIYESNLEPVLRFMHICDIQACGTVSVPFLEAEETISRCYYDLYIPNYRSITPKTSTSSAPFVIGSFDIEVYSHDDSFPKAQIKENVVFQIATTFQKFGSTEPYLRHIICLGETNSTDGVEMVICNSEKELLLEWTKILNREQVDVLLGYNIFGFDFKYLYERAKLNMVTDAFGRFSKISDYSCPLVTKTFSSGAYGDSTHYLPTTPGIFQLDLLVSMRRDYKLESYKLDSVAEHFLDEHKLDVSPKEIFAAYRGSSEDRGRVAKYCVQDVELPLRLINKLATFTNLVEMANVTFVPIDYLILRGQQIKCFSQILRETRKRGMLVKVLEKGGSDGKFQGATVIEPKRGFYNQPISCLDFASLYPSIMRAHKLCHSNWVNSMEYMNLPGVEYWTMEWDDEEDGKRKYVFAQNQEGVLPEILAELAKSRNQSKKDMKNAETPFEKSIYQAKQLAYKVSMNSLYGFCGANNGMLPCKAISETVTARGRQMISETKNFVETHYAPAYVVYGDSVTGDTPLLLRRNGIPFVSRIDNLVPEYHAYGEKEISPCDNLEVWTEQGFTKIENVIRHHTTKQMFRVLTHSGVVDVTEDHSLLLEDGTKISPKEVHVGTKLLHHSTLPAFERVPTATRYNITPHHAKVMGFFFGDGSCGKYGNKYTWALNNADIDFLLEMQALAPFETTIYDTIESSGVYKLNALGDVKSISEMYRAWFYNLEKEKIVPECILNAPLDVVKAFWDGYYMADGDKDAHKYTRFDCKGKQGTFGLSILAERLGYSISFNCRKDKPNVFRVTCTKNYQRKDPTQIKKIIPLGACNDYVYDLTTCNHHFHAGPGHLVVSNTDSVFCSFGPYVEKVLKQDPQNLEAIFKVAFEAGELATQLFKRPVELEYEKTYLPLMLQNKKRYAGLMYTCDDHTKPAYIDKKGIQLVRRDQCAYVKEASLAVLDILMYKIDTLLARNQAREYVQNLLNNKVPFEKLVLSKSLRETYANQNLPHLSVARKIEARNPGEGPKPPERVPYVFIDNDEKEQFKRAEDPAYAKENNLKLDVLYYLEHQLQSPLQSLFELITEDAPTMFDDLKRKFLNKRKGQVEITNFFTIAKKPCNNLLQN